MSVKLNNLSRNFLLPLLGKPYPWYGDALLGTFIGDDTQPELEETGRIFLLISLTRAGENLILNLRSQNNFVIDYKVNDFETMVVMQIPPEFKKDYLHFLNGKFSRMSEAAKKLILDSSPPGGGLNGKILNRDPEMRLALEKDLDVTLPADAEVYSEPKNELERFHGVQQGLPPA